MTPFAARASRLLPALPLRSPSLMPLLRWLRDAHERWRERRLLEEMTDRDLRDMGITRHDALHEAAKPFWRD
ncbi:DUF1127 domain-containing protein [Rhodovarius crocodyli]|nr:DUF1127 domain-containing protein [Rhodovarius crocodyli]